MLCNLFKCSDLHYFECSYLLYFVRTVRTLFRTVQLLPRYDTTTIPTVSPAACERRLHVIEQDGLVLSQQRHDYFTSIFGHLPARVAVRPAATAKPAWSVPVVSDEDK